MSLTYDQIYRYIDEKRITLSHSVKIRKLKTRTPKQTKGVFGIAEATTRSLEKDAWSSYETVIEFYPKKKVILSCGCPDFMYRWEYALAKKGAARIVYGNGEPPGATNPRNRPGACKHIVALHSHLVSQGLVEK